MRLLTLLTSLVAAVLSVAAAEPYCEARLFDEEDGLSQRSVKQIVTDSTGVVWIATWNGLNRFDGYDFAVIRPAPGDSTRRYSSRFRNLRTGADGILWARIDDRLVTLDPATNRYTDIHSDVERRLGRTLDLRDWQMSADGTQVVMDCGDIFVTLPGCTTSATLPAMNYLTPANRRIGDYGPYPYRAQALGRTDADGHVWIVTRTGEVAYADSMGAPARVIADLGVSDGSLSYCTTDRSGGIWLRSTLGAHRLRLGTLPYTRIKGGNEGRALAAMYDGEGRLWVAEPDRQAVAIYPDGPDGEPLYLGADGSLHAGFRAWGGRVYSLASTPDGTVWVGCKPEGLYRLTPQGGGYAVRHMAAGNIYDITSDAEGRVWAAALGSGLLRVEGDTAVAPFPIPRGAVGARRIVREGPHRLLVATTGGLLAIDTSTDSLRLHVTEAGSASSLGCIAVTDIAVTPSGIYTSTESDGVNILTGDPMGRPDFARADSRGGSPLDVASAMQPLPDGRLLVVSHGYIYTIDPTVPGGAPGVMGAGVWHTPLRFTEMRPLILPDGRVLLGTEHGAITTSLDSKESSVVPMVMFTSASIQGRPDTLLTAATTELVLGKTERSLTLRFAAADYDHPADIQYSVRMNGGEWSAPTASRSLSLFDLAPGEYEIEVCVSDPYGRPDGEPRRLLLRVTPRFHETLVARLLFWILVAAVVAAGVRLWIYVRAIKRKQRETLEAYLRLMEERTALTSPPVDVAPAEAESPAPQASVEPEINDRDREFMQRVMDYVGTHIADSEAGVDDMAAEVGVSRSGLTRKMRALMGVSPADFIRQTRLQRAASQLRSTDTPVKIIAIECGFTDLNYFGKCFKGAYGVTPTAWRKGEGS